MALTKPYFNTIPAFDASNSATITLSVLGGQAISQYGYIVYNQSTGAQVTTAEVSVSGDEYSEDIRNFTISLAANTLSNNTSYYIIGYTKTSTISSPYSTPEYFTCYTTPTLSGTITNATSGVINNSTANLSVTFNTNALNSPAEFNNLDLVAYGISREDGSQKIIYQANNVYDISSALNITGFIPNCTDASGTDDPTSLYSSYSIVVSGYTKDLMQIGFTLSNLKCYYSQVSNPTILTVQNLPSTGQILIQFDGTDMQGYTSISYVEVQRKEATSDTWVVLQTIQKSEGFIFDFYDPFCKNDTAYNYRVVPYSTSGAVGSAYTASVLSHFCDAFICDATTSYKITAEYNLGNNSFNQSNTMQVPHGSVYPFVGYNAITQYTSGSTSCVLIANVSPTSSALDRLGQVNIVKNFNLWMTNRRMKALKDFNGNFWLIAVIDAVGNNYYQVLGNSLASLSFNWLEVGDFTQDYLSSLDLYNNFYIANQTKPNDWAEMNWTGLTNFSGSNVWSDGTNIYYSYGSSNQYVLDKETSTWSEKTWSGLTSLFGSFVWKINTNIYYSINGQHYILNKNTNTWEAKTWYGYTNVAGNDIWTDGTNYYYSYNANQYVLNIETDTWEAKTWNGFTNIQGRDVWTDGNNIYYNHDSYKYVLDVDTDTWSVKTWVGGAMVSVGRFIWNDDNNIYYSGGLADRQLVLDAETSTWSIKSWTGFSDMSGSGIWNDGTNTYFSDETTQYKLLK